MIVILIALLIIAGIIIYKLNDSAEDDKLIKSNYSWKERIHTLEDLIKYVDSEEEKELSEREIANGNRTNQERIKSYTEEIIKLKQYISNNEQYLKEKGKHSNR
jgi:hypothetical protein